MKRCSLIVRSLLVLTFAFHLMGFPAFAQPQAAPTATDLSTVKKTEVEKLSAENKALAGGEDLAASADN